MSEAMSKWGEYVKPALWDLMRALRIDVKYHSSSGDYLYYYDDNGKEVGVVDFCGGMGSTLLGHNNPEINKVRTACINENLPFHSQASMREESGLLAEALNKHYPGKEKRIVIFTNSGTEAVEAALKHAEMNRVLKMMELAKRLFRNVNEVREYFRLHSGAALPREYAEAGIEVLVGDILNQARDMQSLRPIVIAAERSFHGKTTGSVRITGNPAYREAFSLLSGIDARFVEFNNVKDLENALKNSYHTIRFLTHENGKIGIREEQFLNVAAFIMEPVQGEGGIHIATAAYMKGVESLRRKYGFEWMLDDIQSGMGRTGKLFAIEHYPVNPDSVDYVILSKSLGGGTNKIGAMMVRESIHDARFGLLHSSTFAEDGESCRVGLKAVEIITRDNSKLLKEVREKGEYMLKRLEEMKKKHPRVIKDVRGIGLMAAVEFTMLEDNSSMFFNRSANQGVLGSLMAAYLFHEHRVRTAPPMNSLVTHKPYNALRLEPSAFIKKKDIDTFIDALDRACEITVKCNAYEFSKFIVGKESPDRHAMVEDYSKPVPPPSKDPAFKNARRMTFLIHPLSIDQVMEEFDPSLHRFSKEVDPATGKNERELYWDILVPLLESFVFKQVNVKSPRTGDRVRANFIAFTYTTKQMNVLRKTDHPRLVAGVQKAVDMCVKMGGDIVGLGAFTSIVTHNGTDLDDTFIRITSGNSYTTALIWQSVLKAAGYMGKNLNKCTAAVVGAGGNIGSVTASLLAEDIPVVYLVGRPRRGAMGDLKKVAQSIYSDVVDTCATTRPENLRGLPAIIARDFVLPLAALGGPGLRFNPEAIDAWINKNLTGKEQKVAHLIKSVFYNRPVEDIGAKFQEAVQIRHGKDPYIIPTMNIKAGIKNADIVVSAVSADTEIIDTSWIKPGAIVNDVSLPPSVSLKLYKERPDVLAIQGGIGRLPEYIDLGIPGLAAGATLGCMAETFILTMMGMMDNYSYGDITKQQVVKIWEAGKILGFGLAAIKYKDTKLTRETASAFKGK